MQIIHTMAQSRLDPGRLPRASRKCSIFLVHGTQGLRLNSAHIPEEPHRWHPIQAIYLIRSNLLEQWWLEQNSLNDYNFATHRLFAFTIPMAGPAPRRLLCLTMLGYKKGGLEEDDLCRLMVNKHAHLIKGLMEKYGIVSYTMVRLTEYRTTRELPYSKIMQGMLN